MRDCKVSTVPNRTILRILAQGQAETNQSYRLLETVREQLLYSRQRFVSFIRLMFRVSTANFDTGPCFNTGLKVFDVFAFPCFCRLALPAS